MANERQSMHVFRATMRHESLALLIPIFADINGALIPIFGIVFGVGFGVGGPIFLALMAFPSIRGAFVRRLSRAALDESVVALQLHVQALQSEVDRLSRALPPPYAGAVSAPQYVPAPPPPPQYLPGTTTP